MSHRSVRALSRSFNIFYCRDYRDAETVCAFVAAALGFAVAACGDIGAPLAAYRQSALGYANDSATSEAFADASAAENSLANEQVPYAPIETVAECVQRHITQSGGADDVKMLQCRGVAGQDCTPPDLSVLSTLENLTFLDLSHRCVSDLGPITKLAKLERLELEGHRVTDIRPLAALRELHTLNLASTTRIKSDWSFRNQLPFSQLTQLVTLNLSGTGYSMIYPLGSLASLEELHLESCEIKSIRPLGPLTGLRELHVDDNWFEDLSPLTGLTQLQVLTATRNAISSIEPLRELAHAGNLREVSLDDNCVVSCDELAGVNSSCANPLSRCESAESLAYGQDFAVPIDHVERLVPPVDFPVWDESQVERGFQLVSTDAGIDWKNARGNCDGRADAAAELLEQAQLPELTKVYAYGNLRPLTSNDPSGFYWFDWHVAVAARTAQGFVVFDPALEPRPLRLRDWYARLVDSRGANLNFSCKDYYPNDGESQCLERVDAQGSMLVDELQSLRGAICNKLECRP